jgi:hypothetical protein
LEFIQASAWPAMQVTFGMDNRYECIQLDVTERNDGTITDRSEFDEIIGICYVWTIA